MDFFICNKKIPYVLLITEKQKNKKRIQFDQTSMLRELLVCPWSCYANLFWCLLHPSLYHQLLPGGGLQINSQSCLAFSMWCFSHLSSVSHKLCRSCVFKQIFIATPISRHSDAFLPPYLSAVYVSKCSNLCDKLYDALCGPQIIFTR